jgi:putative tricarboxylic transport membrane protein
MKNEEALMKGRVWVVGAMIAIAASVSVQAAQWKPAKRIEVIVPNAPGGGNDRLIRLVLKIAQEQKLIEPAVNVIHKPGAGVVMGLSYLNQFAGDGHRIAIVSSTFLGDYASGRSAISPADVTPIAQLFTEYVAFAVKPDSPLRGAREVMMRLKADVASLSASISGGPGNHNHIALSMVARAAGGYPKKLKVVVFSSGADAITAALGGHVDMLVAPAASVLPHVQAGRLRFVALAAPKRLEGAFASVPVWKELGANAVTSNWRGIVGPRGLPQPQVEYWEGVLARVVESDEWKRMLERDLVTNEFLRSARMRDALRSDSEDLRMVMTDLGLIR